MSPSLGSYMVRGKMCSREEMTLPSLISSVMVQICVLTWEAGAQGTVGAHGTVETNGTLMAGLHSELQGWAGSLGKESD